MKYSFILSFIYNYQGTLKGLEEKHHFIQFWTQSKPYFAEDNLSMSEWTRLSTLYRNKYQRSHQRSFNPLRVICPARKWITPHCHNGFRKLSRTRLWVLFITSKPKQVLSGTQTHLDGLVTVSVHFWELYLFILGNSYTFTFTRDDCTALHNPPLLFVWNVFYNAVRVWSRADFDTNSAGQLL